MSAIYKGEFANTTPFYTDQGQSRTRVLDGIVNVSVREGKFADCLAALPSIGDVDTKMGGYVTAASVEQTQAGLGRLTVQSESRNGTAIYEIDWQQIQKSIKDHPRYNGGAYTLTDTDWEHIDAALAGQKQTSAGASVDVSSPAGRANAYTKMRKGIDSYVVFAPVARKTTRNILIFSAGSNLGSYSATAPFAGCPSGYKWLKTSDRARKEGPFWERTEEWLGADNWDPQLYS